MFKAGDVVELLPEVNGRTCPISSTEQFIVAEDEDTVSGMVSIRKLTTPKYYIDFDVCWCFLRLVVSANDSVKRYGVRDNVDAQCIEVYNHRFKTAVASLYYGDGVSYTKSEAEEMAEQECEYLNTTRKKLTT